MSKEEKFSGRRYLGKPDALLTIAADFRDLSVQELTRLYFETAKEYVSLSLTDLFYLFDRWQRITQIEDSAGADYAETSSEVATMQEQDLAMSNAEVFSEFLGYIAGQVQKARADESVRRINEEVSWFSKMVLPTEKADELVMQTFRSFIAIRCIPIEIAGKVARIGVTAAQFSVIAETFNIDPEIETPLMAKVIIRDTDENVLFTVVVPLLISDQLLPESEGHLFVSKQFADLVRTGLGTKLATLTKDNRLPPIEIVEIHSPPNALNLDHLAHDQQGPKK